MHLNIKTKLIAIAASVLLMTLSAGSAYAETVKFREDTKIGTVETFNPNWIQITPQGTIKVKVRLWFNNDQSQKPGGFHYRFKERIQSVMSKDGNSDEEIQEAKNTVDMIQYNLIELEIDPDKKLARNWMTIPYDRMGRVISDFREDYDNPTWEPYSPGGRAETLVKKIVQLVEEKEERIKRLRQGQTQQ